MKWRFQSRFSSNIRPRYLTYLHVLIFWLLTLKLRCFVIGLFFRWKTIIAALLAFWFILFARSQWHIKERSRFKMMKIQPLTIVKLPTSLTTILSQLLILQSRTLIIPINAFLNTENINALILYLFNQQTAWK